MSRLSSASVVLTRVLAVLVLGTLAVLTLAPDALAQRGQRGERRAPDKATWVEQQMTSLTETMTLMQAQAAEVRVLFAAHFDKMEAMRESIQGQGRDARQGLREKMQALQDETDAEVLLLLSPEQAVTYQAWREAQQARRRGGSRRIGG